MEFSKKPRNWILCLTFAISSVQSYLLPTKSFSKNLSTLLLFKINEYPNLFIWWVYIHTFWNEKKYQSSFIFWNFEIISGSSLQPSRSSPAKCLATSSSWCRRRRTTPPWKQRTSPSPTSTWSPAATTTSILTTSWRSCHLANPWCKYFLEHCIGHEKWSLLEWVLNEKYWEYITRIYEAWLGDLLKRNG